MNRHHLFMLALALALLSGCDLVSRQTGNNRLQASGTITANTIQVAPEVGGKILEVKAGKGATVKQGDLLFRLDDQVLQAQRGQAEAGVKVGQANLELARQKLANALVQYDITEQTVRAQYQKSRVSTWRNSPPENVDLPVWYFNKDEEIAALRAQVSAAEKNLDTELGNLDNEIKKTSNKDFVAAEKRLVEAQQAIAVAKTVLDQAKNAKDKDYLEDSAQRSYDSVLSELRAAQRVYNNMLTGDSAKRIKEARARVAVARERLDNTRDAIDRLLVGEQSLQISAAQLAVDQAKAGVTQAEAALEQAKASLDLIKVQLAKFSVFAPSAGTVLSQPLKAGEIAAAGAVVVEIGGLETVTLTVYIPENKYGQIRIDQKALITVDSFPGKSFSGKVVYIADQAEFTPRNVQTTESRSATVFKIEISIANMSAELKPGMPADAVFE